jgi:hypothetical protein
MYFIFYLNLHFVSTDILAEVVGFELTVPCDTTVFKTAPLDLSGTLPDLEHRAGFEPAALEFCRLLHWATLPPMRNSWSGVRESNPH